MRTSDVDILIIPGWSSSGPDHWQSRWERSLTTARRVEQDDWFKPSRDKWVASIAAAVVNAARPPVLVAHSLGCAAVVHVAHKLPRGLVAGAFLVAPADVDLAASWPVTAGYVFDRDHGGFAPLPRAALPFPSALVASQDDPYCSFERARELAYDWGAALVDGGQSGHINVSSGHGPWPEGLLRFGSFLKSLG
ncbi:MAG: alpha/beta hydrolase [Hyphomicrobium sp.]